MPGSAFEARPDAGAPGRPEHALCAAPVPILTYHQIDAPPPRGTPFRSLSVHPQVFARHMHWLARLGYRGLSMRELMPYLSGARAGKVFGLTFDDGFLNVHRHALPVLEALGFSATNYVVAGQIGGWNAWDAEKGVPRSPLMGGREIAEWTAAGNEIGAHTLDHADLARLDDAAAQAQIAGSRKMLEDLLGVPVDAFCYPYGSYRQQHAAIARAAGFTSATTTVRGRVRAGADLWQLPRVPVVRATGFLQLAQKLFTAYEERRARRG